MTLLKASIATSLLVAFAASAGCSSSSSGGAAGSDGGAGLDATSDGGGGIGTINATCGQLATIGGGTAASCPQGQACCTTFSITTLSATSTCMPVGQCPGGVSNECQTGADCTGGAVCCAGAASADASAEGGGGGGGFGAFNPSALNTTCQASCQPGQRQQCASDSECPHGQACAAAFGAGAFGDGGALGAGFGALDAGGDAAAFAVPKVCMAPPAEGGAPDAGAAPDAEATTDAGSAADAGAASDASAD